MRTRDIEQLDGMESFRTYSGYAKLDAAEIVAEVIRFGRSVGWSGEVRDREAIEEITDGFGVDYVDDMRGEWRMQPSRARSKEFYAWRKERRFVADLATVPHLREHQGIEGPGFVYGEGGAYLCIDPGGTFSTDCGQDAPSSGSLDDVERVLFDYLVGEGAL